MQSTVVNKELRQIIKKKVSHIVPTAKENSSATILAVLPCTPFNLVMKGSLKWVPEGTSVNITVEPNHYRHVAILTSKEQNKRILHSEPRILLP